LLAVARTGGSLPPELARSHEPDHLTARERRYRLQLLLKSIPLVGSMLVKPHKLKVLGGHHAVSVRCLRAVNGYDEDYVGYGYDDDDLSRRVYSIRQPPKVAIAIRRIHAYHLWHATRAPSRPTSAPGYERFRRRDLPTAAVHGWKNPTKQPQPCVHRVRETPESDAVPVWIPVQPAIRRPSPAPGLTPQ
jgi:hypothetical protein